MAFKLNNINKEIQQNKNADNFRLEELLKKEIFLFGNSFNNKKKQYFYQELSVLLKAGITIKDALSIIFDNLKKKTDKDLIQSILNKLINGMSFSDAIKLSNKFSEYEYYSLKIGEETGTTSIVCYELGVFFERKNEQKRVVIAALSYPSIVITTALLVVFFMLSYVVPMFQDIFKQNKMELPAITKFIILLSEGIQNYKYFILIVIVAIIVGFPMLYKNLLFRKRFHYLILKIPIFGSFTAKIYLAQFTQAVSLLTMSKIPMLNSIQLVSKMIDFIPLKEALMKVELNVLKGNTLSSSLTENKLFDNRIISLVKVAEETNQTEFVFKQLNEQYSQEVMLQSKVMTTVLEPFIILFVGIIVAVLLIAMYLPMFQLSSAIG